MVLVGMRGKPEGGTRERDTTSADTTRGNGNRRPIGNSKVNGIKGDNEGKADDCTGNFLTIDLRNEILILF